MSGDQALRKPEGAFIKALKYGDWLNSDRVWLWARAFSCAWVFLLIFDFVTHSTHGITNAEGEHIGRDFINYWAGAKEALAGKASGVYDWDGFNSFEQSLIGTPSEAKMYSYPPALLLLTLPLGFLPFIPAFLLWSGLGVAMTTMLVRAQTGWRWQLAFLAAFAAPASVWNLVAGQNGFLSAAFFAGGLLMLERQRPIVAGILIGFLCYKPQLGLLVPIALLAGREWRAFFAAAATVVVILATTYFAFGLDAWLAFLHQMKIQSAMLESQVWMRMPTVYSGLRVLGVANGLSFAAQALSTLLAAGVVAKIWFSQSPYTVKIPALCLAAFLATPYAWDYDMVVLTFAVLWLLREGEKTGFRPWEKFTWMLVILLPTPLMAGAQYLGVQPGPFVLWFALMLVLRRVLQPTPSA